MDDWLHALLRFAQYGLLLGLFGWTAFRAIMAPLIEPNSETGSSARLISVPALLAPIVSTALMAASIAAMMGQAVGSLEWSVVEAIVLTTSPGWAFIARLGLLVAAILLLFVRPGLRLVIDPAALLYGLALATLAWSGHAAASEGALGLLHRSNDGLHLLAAGLWIGAIGWFVYLSYAAHRKSGQIAAEPVLAAMHRFAPLGVTLVVVVAVTGVINAHLIFGLENSTAVLRTSYGALLLVKLAAVGLMAFCGAYNATNLRREGNVDDLSSRLNLLRVSLTAEILFAAVTMIAVAGLGIASPVM